MVPHREKKKVCHKLLIIQTAWLEEAGRKGSGVGEAPTIRIYTGRTGGEMFSVRPKKWQECPYHRGQQSPSSGRPPSRGSQLSELGKGSHPRLRLDVVLPGSWSPWASRCHGSVKSKPQVQRWTTTTKSSSKVNDHGKVIQWELRCHTGYCTEKENLVLKIFK